MLVHDYEVILQEIEEEAPDKGWPIVGPDKGVVLIDACHEHKPQLVLELGALVGYSSILIAANLPDGGRVVSIEIDPQNVEITQRNQLRAGLADRCEVVEGDALQVIPTLAGPWDMLFIDAAKTDYLRYLQLAEPALSPNAVIVADNVLRFADEVAPYLDYVRNSGNYESSFHEFDDDAVEVSVRKPAA
ncbi:MAG: class I SAM-dependent methyltransferase [Dehalococcoidia bacterium]